MGPFPRPWGVAKAVGSGQGLGGVAKDVCFSPRPWGRGQGSRGVAKAVGAWPRSWGVTKALGAWPRP